MRSFFCAIVLAAGASSARAECDDLRSVLSSPLSGDTTLELPGDTDCPIIGAGIDDAGELEEFVVEGGTLTLTGPSTTKFTNLRFTVMDGAGLVFDYAVTEFGPNLGYERADDYGGFMVQVMSGGSVKFTGEMTGTGLENMRSVFYNNAGGSIEFASHARFYDCDSNVFRDNLGRLRFFGDVDFEGNRYIAISNDGGTVRINGDARFMENGASFDGNSGGAFSNDNGGHAVFRGTSFFGSNSCDEDGGAVHNGAGSKMTFYKRAEFYDNRSKDGDGGAVHNEGELKFRGAVRATGNRAAETGGAIATHGGGSTTFYGWATIQSNDARFNGGGMSIYEDGVVEFRKPSRVRASVNEVTQPEGVACNEVYLDETSELIGYEAEDICDATG